SVGGSVRCGQETGGNRLAQRLGGPTLQRLFALMLVAVSFSLAAQKLYGG
ncbi:sulfite exporter TauE/SafE family protein, partial [Pseudomonas aeruginosa]|nr:sulfite exporter TauE/SafE family protein [Pseudomonas aeruginosa]